MQQFISQRTGGLAKQNSKWTRMRISVKASAALRDVNREDE
jgi:hypothetical protein